LKKFDLEPTAFIQEMKSERIRKQTFDEFSQVSNWGVKGFPAVLMFHEGKGYMVSNGYTDLASLESQVSEILKK
jgi:protein-disulfide isomerase-like protein with CxxC motif